MPRQPVSKKQGLSRHPVSPKGVLLRQRSEAAIQEAAI